MKLKVLQTLGMTMLYYRQRIANAVEAVTPHAIFSLGILVVLRLRLFTSVFKSDYFKATQINK